MAVSYNHPLAGYLGLSAPGDKGQGKIRSEGSVLGVCRIHPPAHSCRGLNEASSPSREGDQAV